jgi:hypothetical protein
MNRIWDILNVEENNQGTVGFLFTISFLMGLFSVANMSNVRDAKQLVGSEDVGTRYPLHRGIFHYPYHA